MSKTDQLRTELARAVRVKAARKDPAVNSYITELEQRIAALESANQLALDGSDEATTKNKKR